MKSLLKHQGCDICIYNCPQPIIISLCGKTFRGHKECMHEKMNEIRKERSRLIEETFRHNWDEPKSNEFI